MPTGVYIRTAETRKRMSDARKGTVHSLETRQKLAELARQGIIGNKGKPHSEEWKRKISEALLGEKHPFFGVRGEKAANWKGEDVGYSGIHMWIRGQLGLPTECEQCGKDNLTGKKIHWANKSHEYKRDLEDWMRVCVSCHKKYDLERIRNVN